MAQIIFTILVFLCSTNLHAASEPTETFRYGPQSFEDYDLTYAIISDFSFPKWLEGSWWAMYYSDPSMQEVVKIPRKPEQKMGRPFEFYGWLVRVPEGTDTHKDYKAVNLTEMGKGKAWVLNMVSIENPSRGASLVINKVMLEGTAKESLVFRWRLGIISVQKRAIHAFSIGVGSILEIEEIRKSYLSEKYLISPSIEEFDYKEWYSSVTSTKSKAETN